MTAPHKTCRYSTETRHNIPYVNYNQQTNMKTLISVLLVFSLVIGRSALAQSPNYSNTIQESDYPCALVLCFANPAGPLAAPACRPPVNWLFNLLRHFKPFPVCNMSNGGQANYSYRPHVACPGEFTAESATDSDTGNTYLTGRCLRQVSDCSVAAPAGIQTQCMVQPIMADGYSSDYVVGYQTFQVYSPPTGVTSYQMTLNLPGQQPQVFYFNLQ